ncbi:MAG: polysaccharide lyase family protein [Planctomycetaceae bacterium]|nr:polysaccharide lyase family protein [Planctomycetaceae bacterium]
MQRISPPLLLTTLICTGFTVLSFGTEPARVATDIIFQIGRPDAVCWEFQGTADWRKSRDKDGVSFRYVVGKNRAKDWVAMHPSTRDFGNAGESFTTQIEFELHDEPPPQLYFIMGFCFVSCQEPSLIRVKLNGVEAEPVRQPDTFNDYSYKPQEQVGIFTSLTIPLPAQAAKKGGNVISITLEDGSFFLYDYVMLRMTPTVPEQLPVRDLLTEFRKNEMRDARYILYASRQPGRDPHWYANFGYYIDDVDDFPFPLGSGGGLHILDLDTKEVKTIFWDPKGNVRDPQVHYDAEKVLFSYLPAGKRHYNLFEINIDGTGLRQLTFGDWDDIEPTYTAGGDIIFSSSRCKRWVQCAASPVATLHRCGPNGENIRPVSSNNDQDNTPWPLPNGQIIYMRWDYIDRSQMDYHHLWTMNPDGTRHQVYYGNLNPGMVMLAAKPIPGSDKIVACFSPGHGLREHYGRIAVVDPRNGPDDPESAVMITGYNDFSDPWAFSETAFMAASYSKLQLIDGDGYVQTVYELPEELKSQGFWIGEPRPVMRREREAIIADQVDLTQNTGRLILTDIYRGRRLKDLPRGTIKDLLVLEPLPAPVHYNGGMEMISLGGTFMLTRVIGTIPVTPEGSSYMELPAGRSFLFVARDENGDSVKRMHSFATVMPGETSMCIGCHESRLEAPSTELHASLLELAASPPSVPKPIDGVPDIFDFPRDIQPILDRHCVTCHNNDRADGGINLSPDWGPIYQYSYDTLSLHRMFGDNRNRAKSDFEPYEIGTKASKLLRLVDSHHQGVELAPQEIKMLRYWIEAGANFAGTYAADYSGVIGYNYNFGYTSHDENWPETAAMSDAIQRRCAECHRADNHRKLPLRLSDFDSNFSRLIVFNLSHPEQSRMLTGPLAKKAGGKGKCGRAVFESTADPDYQAILAGINRAVRYINEESNRFTMRPFVPNHSYAREMVRYGVLPPDHDLKSPLDPYETDRRYWELMTVPPQIDAGHPTQTR